MNRKLLCVANVQYKKPTADNTRRHKGLLRYLTYRDGRDGHIRQRGGAERWHDLGLGGSIAEIAARCEALRSEHVLAWSLVFNVNPELTRMVDPPERAAFVCALTECILEEFFEARGVEGSVEASYVLHHRQSENPEAPDLADPHTHVVVPGTYFDEGTGQRERLFFSRSKGENHIDLLHRITEDVTADLLTEYAGPDWEARYDALEGVRTAQRGVVEAEPAHGVAVDETHGDADIWAGVRQTDETTSAAGYYAHYYPDRRRVRDGADPKATRVEFRPLLAGLDHTEALTVAGAFREYLARHRTLEALEGWVIQWAEGSEQAINEVNALRITPSPALEL